MILPPSCSVDTSQWSRHCRMGTYSLMCPYQALGDPLTVHSLSNLKADGHTTRDSNIFQEKWKGTLHFWKAHCRQGPKYNADDLCYLNQQCLWQSSTSSIQPELPTLTWTNHLCKGMRDSELHWLQPCEQSTVISHLGIHITSIITSSAIKWVVNKSKVKLFLTEVHSGRNEQHSVELTDWLIIAKGMHFLVQPVVNLFPLQVGEGVQTSSTTKRETLKQTTEDILYHP